MHVCPTFVKLPAPPSSYLYRIIFSTYISQICEYLQMDFFYNQQHTNHLLSKVSDLEMNFSWPYLFPSCHLLKTYPRSKFSLCTYLIDHLSQLLKICTLKNIVFYSIIYYAVYIF